METPSIQTKRRKKEKGPSPEHITVKNPEWSYAHLKMIYDPPYPPSTTTPSYPPDILTWRTTLTACLTQFLGLMGSAIQIDILHQEHDEAWLRLPGDDLRMFTVAVSGYVGATDGRSVGFQTLGMGNFLMGLVGKAGEDELWA